MLQGKDGSSRGVEKIKTLHGNANFMRKKLGEMGCAILGDDNSPVMVRVLQQLLHIHLSDGLSVMCFRIPLLSSLVVHFQCLQQCGHKWQRPTWQVQQDLAYTNQAS